MKKLIIASVFFLIGTVTVLAQDAIQTSLKNAVEQYNQKKILAVQNSVCNALIEINNQLGAQMLSVLPATAGNLFSNHEGDTNGQQGTDPSCNSINITREYSNEQNQSITINISQNLATANNITTAISQITNTVDEGVLQKTIALNGGKAMLVWDIEASEGDIEYAKGNVFVIFTSVGFESTDSFADAVSKIDFAKTLAVLGQ